jgi:DNA-binding NarL/FixJ family response regulator
MGFGSPTKWSGAAISVLVCDDGALSRRQLTVALEQSELIEVVAEAGDGDTALAEAIEATPDVIWMGAQLGGLAGVRLIASIHELVPASRFVVVCGPDDTEIRARALRVGAFGFVRREEAPGCAAQATEQVAWGWPWLEPRDLDVLRQSFAALSRQAGSVQQQLEPPRLDAGLQAVLDALGDGAEPAAVAASLGMSEDAVMAGVATALERLHRHSRSEAMAYALDERVFEQGGPA